MESTIVAALLGAQGLENVVIEQIACGGRDCQVNVVTSNSDRNYYPALGQVAENIGLADSTSAVSLEVELANSGSSDVDVLRMSTRVDRLSAEDQSRFPVPADVLRRLAENAGGADDDNAPIKIGRDLFVETICSTDCPLDTRRMIYMSVRQDQTCAGLRGIEQSMFVRTESGDLAERTFCVPNTLIGPDPDSPGPSWLTFLGHSKDSLWSLDLFRCESLILRTHWAMVVMDQFTRRIIGFAVHAAPLDGPAVCRLLGKAIGGHSALPHRLSSDHDPLFEYRQWKANLRILDIDEVKTVPYVPLSHPFVERLVGTIRRELLDEIPFWSVRDLERKLLHFKAYYNRERAHSSLAGLTPNSKAGAPSSDVLRLTEYRWKTHCRGLYQLPAAA